MDFNFPYVVSLISGVDMGKCVIWLKSMLLKTSEIGQKIIEEVKCL